jgi:hypothetical protein
MDLVANGIEASSKGVRAQAVRWGALEAVKSVKKVKRVKTLKRADCPGVV